MRAFLATLLAAFILTSPAQAGPADVETLDGALARPGRPPAEQAELLLRRGDALARLGFLPRAVDDYRRALELADGPGAGNDTLTRQAHAGLGAALLRQGEREDARRHLDACVSLAHGAGDRAAASAAQVGLGVLHGLSAQPAEARRSFEAALRDADAAGRPAVAARAALNAARVSLDAGDAASARGWLGQAAARLDKLGEDAEAPLLLVAFARLTARAEGSNGDQTVYETLSRAAALAQRLDDRRAESFAWGYLGQLYERAGRAADARTLTERAVAAAVAARAPESLYLWEWQSARLAAARGEAKAALDAYARAVGTLEEVRGELAGDALQGAGVFREAIEPVYLGYAELLLRPSRDGGGDDQGTLRRARAVMEQLKAAELEDYFKDDCVASLDSRTRPIDRVAERTAAIYPILLPGRAELLVGIGDQIRRVTVPVGRAALTRSVNEFRGFLEKRATHQYMERAKQIYDWLVRPLEPLLAEARVDTLVIVPDGPLRTIPLAALHDGRDFLVRRYAVSLSPGLTLIDPRPLPRERASALLAGLSVGVQGFPALPQVRDELAKIAEIYPARTLLDGDFLGDGLAAELRRTPYNVVHIASHGEFLGEHRKSFLLTYDGRLTLDRLEALVRLGRFRTDPVEILVLSACRTAAGDDRAALGLAGVAIKAGARSALASLWYVSDEASADLMQAFYRTLRHGDASKAQAVRRAQLALLDNPRFRHPFYWGAFVLIGNWL